jgi:hypothetical protein
MPAIPSPPEKPEWPVAERAKWLQTAANIFDLIYKGEGGITVSASARRTFTASARSRIDEGAN